MSKSTKQILSLFSGCGGMDLGFEGGFDVLKKSINTKIHPQWTKPSSKENWVKLPNTMFKTVFANDIMSAAKASWVPYFSKRGNTEDDFHLLSIVDLVKNFKAGKLDIFPHVDIVTGGFPCQDFSVAGKRKGFNSHKGHHGNILTEIDNPTGENRGKLYIWMKHVIDIVRPKIFIAENVKGLISLTDAKQVIENDFRNIGSGYIVVAQILYAPMFGIPQSRERLFFIGFKKDALNKKAAEELSNKQLSNDYSPYPPPTHGSAAQHLFKEKKLNPYVTVGDCILDLAEPEFAEDLSQKVYSKAKWYGNHCQGQIEVDLGGISPTIRAEHHGNIEFRRLSIEHGGKYKIELIKGLIERRLTIRECARIQTFPDDFEFIRDYSTLGKSYKLSASEGYKVIGNAVPPLLAFHLAWRLQEIWPRIMKR